MECDHPSQLCSYCPHIMKCSIYKKYIPVGTYLTGDILVDGYPMRDYMYGPNKKAWPVEKNKTEETKQSDPVNHPSHYTNGDIECIDAIKASMTKEEFLGYLKGNCIKYVWRYRIKGKEKEDLQKAQWYLNRLLEEL